MFLSVTARIPVLDIGVDAGLISKFEVGITLSAEAEEFQAAGLAVPRKTDDEGLAVAELGKAQVDRLHLNLTAEYEENLYDVCDADSNEWEAIFTAFLDRKEGSIVFYKDIPELEDCLTGDVLFIGDIRLKKEYQNRGLEMGIAKRLIDTLGSGCDLIVYFFAQYPDELKALEPMGFQKASVEGYAYLNPTWLHPIPIEAGFARFAIQSEPVPTEEVVESEPKATGELPN